MRARTSIYFTGVITPLQLFAGPCAIPLGTGATHVRIIDEGHSGNAHQVARGALLRSQEAAGTVMATPKQLIKRNGGKTARIDVTPEGLRVITTMAAAGQDQRTIAKRLGLGSHQTLRDIAKRDDAVQEALDVGHAVLADEVTHLLLEQGRKGNTVALIFLSKARLGWSDQGVLPDARPNIVINLPDSKSPDAYLAAIAEANAKALPPLAPKGITLEPAPTDDSPNQTVVYSG